MPSLKAMPGRVVLKFPKPEEETKGGIIIPQTSQMRPEFPLIYHVGDALTEEDEKLRRYLLELQRAGIRLAVSFMSGVSYWKENYDPKVYGWMKDYRAYSFREIASILVEDDELAEATA